MAEKQRKYFCIDMKTFYASVECAEEKTYFDNIYDIQIREI